MESGQNGFVSIRFLPRETHQCKESWKDNQKPSGAPEEFVSNMETSTLRFRGSLVGEVKEEYHAQRSIETRIDSQFDGQTCDEARNLIGSEVTNDAATEGQD